MPNTKDFLSILILLKLCLLQCLPESLPVPCLQNIHIQSAISSIAINKESLMPTCYNFILYTLYRKRSFTSCVSEALMLHENKALSVHMRHDCTLRESTVCTAERKTRWPKRSLSPLTSTGVHSIENCILITRCRILCGNWKFFHWKFFSISSLL